MGLELIPAMVVNRDDYARAFATIVASGSTALAIQSHPLFPRDVKQLAALALEARLPTICEWRQMAEAGCVLGNGPSLSELRRQTATYVARILEGAAAADLPVEGPTRFEFAINLTTARALGLKIPQAILLRADEVIE
jgi:putative ABC transport system substrate-binding protein